MILEVLKLVTLLAAVALLGMIGPLWASAGVGVAFAASSLASIWTVRHYDGISMLAILKGMLGPLVACAPLAAAVVGTREGMTALGFAETPLCLGAELVAGAAAYVVSAFVLAPGTAREFLRLLGNALRRGADDEGPEA